MDVRRLSIGGGGGVFWIAWFASAQTLSQAGSVEPDALIDALSSDDTARLEQTVADIQSSLSTPPRWSAGNTEWGPWSQKVRRLERVWVPALMRAGHPAEAAELALTGMTASPTTTFLTPLGKLRVEALLAAGKPDRALAAARVYYDVCPMDQTAVAIDLIGRCLAATHPDDPDVVRRLRLEQTDGATTRPYAAGTLTPPTTQPALLSGIPRDAEADKAYATAVSLHHTSGDESYALLRMGNALLMAGDPQSARAAFERAAERCVGAAKGAYARPEALAEAMDGIARSLKAEDGTVGRANALVLNWRSAAGL